MYPIFFSVSSEDVGFAEQVWASFGSDLIYLYSKSGRQGAEFWNEIERQELPSARAIVIFWSWAFVRSGGTQREIALASNLFKRGQLRSAVVLRLDDCPLRILDGEKDPAVCQAFEDLAPFLGVTRASEESVSLALACNLCDAVVSRFVVASPPVFQRPLLEEEFFRQARIDQRRFRPVIWLSGLNGNGRRTLVREVFRRIDPNALPVEVDISECTIPKQVVLRLESEGFQCSDQRLREINADPSMDSPQMVAAVVARIRSSGRYVILRQQRVLEDRVSLPEWLVDVALALEPSARPAAFVISAVPITAEALRRSDDRIGAVRIVSLLSHDASDFAWSLIRHYDSLPDRWSEDLVRRVVQETGGNPELILGVVRLATRLDDLEALAPMVGQETDRFSQGLTNFVDWAISRFADEIDCLMILRLLQDVSPVSIDSIREMLGLSGPAARSLARLMAVGLVESSDTGLYRLSPLLARRLDRYLIGRDLLDRYSAALKDYLHLPHPVADIEHGYIRIEAAVNAALRFGRDAVPQRVREFVSAAHWFQAGVRLYSSRHYRDAHLILNEAFLLRSAFSRQPQMEVSRYFGLASVRVHSNEDVIAAIDALRQFPTGQELVDYLLGYQAELAHQFVDAMNHYLLIRPDEV